MENNQLPLPPTTVGTPVSLREITELLIKHYGLHEGHFDLLMEFQIGVGIISQQIEQQPSPTAMVGISRLGLTHATTISPNTVDAAIINPAPIKKKKLSK